MQTEKLPRLLFNASIKKENCIVNLGNQYCMQPCTIAYGHPSPLIRNMNPETYI